MLDRTFSLTEHGTNFFREVLAGLTTFLTMAYILVVQPSVLSTDFAGQPTGLDAGAVLLATCVASAFACLVMGLYGKLPIALAPGMGQNFFFVGVVMSLAGQQLSSDPWKAALAIVLIAGVLFLVLTLLGVRSVVLEVMSSSMRSAIAVGIGLFIAFIGLKNANVVVDSPGTLLMLNTTGLLSPDSAVFWSGFLVTVLLAVRRFPGGILAGIVVAASVAWYFGKLKLGDGGEMAAADVFGVPQIETNAAFQFDFKASIHQHWFDLCCCFPVHGHL